MSKKNCFLFINNTDYNSRNLTGGHRRFLELVKSASKKNDVILVSREIPGLNERNIKRIEARACSKSWMPAHWKKIIMLSKILRKKKNDIRYDYAISFGPSDVICYKISGYDNIVTLFREDFVGYRKTLGVSAVKMLYYKWLEKYTVKNSEKIIVQCMDDKKALISRHYANNKNLESKIYIQINNVNASWMKGNYSRGDKNSDGDVNIAFVGNFSDSRKGHQLLLPAAHRLIREGYKIRLLVAGEGREWEDYKNYYKNCKNIVFMGRVKNVGKMLAESDFEIVPSLIDSCPNTVLEGIASGIAVYGTNVGGIKDILGEKKYMFEPSVDSIYEFLKKVIDEKKYINDAVAQKTIKDRLTFDWGEKILKIITKEMD